MSETPRNTQDEDRSSLGLRLALLFRDSAWIRIPLVLISGGIIEAVMLFLSSFVPGYIVVLLVYVLGLLGWGLLIGFPSKGPTKKSSSEFVRLWVFFALIWAGALCLIYAEGLRQGHDSASTNWYLIGVSLGSAGVIVGRKYYSWKWSKKRGGR
jgi:hypothetical protein